MGGAAKGVYIIAVKVGTLLCSSHTRSQAVALTRSNWMYSGLHCATLQVIDSDGSGTVSASIAGIDYAVSQVCERLRR